MLDMVRIGARISELRKKMDMTQMALADKMDVSFQAVSRWERGQSMPEVSRLPELAQALGVSVDELLGSQGAARAVQAAVEQEAALPPQSAPRAVDVVELMPAMKPSQAERAAERVSDLNWATLAGMAPFLEEDVLERLVDELLQKEGARLQDVAAVAPFLSDEALDRLVSGTALGEQPLEDVLALAPFLSNETLDKLAENVKDGDLGELIGLAPFLSDKTLGDMAQRRLDKSGDVSAIVELAPFMDDVTLSAIAEEIVKTKGFAAVLPLMPFVGSSFMRK